MKRSKEEGERKRKQSGGSEEKGVKSQISEEEAGEEEGARKREYVNRFVTKNAEKKLRWKGAGHRTQECVTTMTKHG